MSVYHLHSVPMKDRRYQIPWDWRYRQLWTAVGILGIERSSSVRTAELLAARLIFPALKTVHVNITTAKSPNYKVNTHYNLTALFAGLILRQDFMGTRLASNSLYSERWLWLLIILPLCFQNAEIAGWATTPGLQEMGSDPGLWAHHTIMLSQTPHSSSWTTSLVMGYIFGKALSYIAQADLKFTETQSSLEHTPPSSCFSLLSQIEYKLYLSSQLCSITGSQFSLFAFLVGRRLPFRGYPFRGPRLGSSMHTGWFRTTWLQFQEIQHSLRTSMGTSTYSLHTYTH